MKTKIRIGILGIGAVGGYFGGRLAQKYATSDSVEIVFITRASTECIIKNYGLTLLTSDSEDFVYHNLVTSDLNKVGVLDYLICAVKSYDLEESLLSLKSSISDNTVILSLQNGVDTKERIQKIYPTIEVLEGCAYIVAKLVAPATVQVMGKMHSLYFGSPTVSAKRQNELADILNADGIDCYLLPNIRQLLWEKFVFVSSLATLTSFLNLSIGPILEDENHRTKLRQLVTEAANIANRNTVLLPDIVEITMKKFTTLNYDATSSMHNDFLKGRKTESQILTNFIVVSGLRLGVPTPEYDSIMATYLQWKMDYVL